MIYCRDELYKLIRLWEDNHDKPNWSLIDKQGAAIHRLVTQNAELVNYIQFARLVPLSPIKRNESDTHQFAWFLTNFP